MRELKKQNKIAICYYEHMIKLSNVSKSFGSKKALQGVSFSVNAGEVFALIGPNGSGKTTLIKILAGLLRPSSGSAVINDADILTEPQKAKSATGYIPDNPTAWSEMTGREFLDFTGVLYGMDQQQRKEQIDALLPEFDLEPVADSLFKSYSRGTRQKFSILSAFLHDPAVILVDEPIVGLDQESVKIMKKLFADFANDGGTVFITTHTLPVVADIGDRFGVLQSGTVVASGTLAELQASSEADNQDLVEIYESLLANDRLEND